MNKSEKKKKKNTQNCDLHENGLNIMWICGSNAIKKQKQEHNPSTY